MWSDCRSSGGALALADLLERVPVDVMDADVDCRAREEAGVVAPAKGEQRWSVGWVSPADKAGGAP